MLQEIKYEIDKLVTEIKNKFPETEIILFGSYANGKATSESDIDLCIIIEQSLMRKIDLIKEIRKVIAPISTKPVDIIVYNRDEFIRRSELKLNTTFEFKIKNEGLKIA